MVPLNDKDARRVSIRPRKEVLDFGDSTLKTYNKMEFANGKKDVVDPEVRAYVSSLVTAVCSSNSK